VIFTLCLATKVTRFGRFARRATIVSLANTTTRPLTEDETYLTPPEAVKILFDRFFGKTSKYLAFSVIPYVLAKYLEEYIFEHAGPEFKEKWGKFRAYNLPVIVAMTSTLLVICFPDETDAIITFALKGVGKLVKVINRLSKLVHSEGVKGYLVGRSAVLRRKLRKLREIFYRNLKDRPVEVEPKPWGIRKYKKILKRIKDIPTGNGGRLTQPKPKKLPGKPFDFPPDAPAVKGGTKAV